MEPQKRIYFFDNVKAILIILVVVGHFIDIASDSSRVYRSIFVFIYSFHMPLFIFISGMFHKDEHIFQKAITNIVICVILNILLFSTNLILYQRTMFHLLTNSGVPWFIFMLAIYEVLA